MNESLHYVTARVGFETLPRLYSFTDDVSSAARSIVARGRRVQHQSAQRALWRAAEGAGSGRAGLRLARAARALMHRRIYAPTH